MCVRSCMLNARLPSPNYSHQKTRHELEEGNPLHNLPLIYRKLCKVHKVKLSEVMQGDVEYELRERKRINTKLFRNVVFIYTICELSNSCHSSLMSQSWIRLRMIWIYIVAPIVLAFSTSKLWLQIIKHQISRSGVRTLSGWRWNAIICRYLLAGNIMCCASARKPNTSLSYLPVGVRNTCKVLWLYLQQRALSLVSIAQQSFPSYIFIRIKVIPRMKSYYTYGH